MLWGGFDDVLVKVELWHLWNGDGFAPVGNLLLLLVWLSAPDSPSSWPLPLLLLLTEDSPRTTNAAVVEVDPLRLATTAAVPGV